MRLHSAIRFADEKLRREFYKLERGDSLERETFKCVNQAMDNLEENAFCGIQLPKKLIPKEYIRKYGIGNLWKYDLPKGWRLLYALKRKEIVVVSMILEWLNHKSYDKRFGY